MLARRLPSGELRSGPRTAGVGGLSPAVAPPPAADGVVGLRRAWQDAAVAGAVEAAMAGAVRRRGIAGGAVVAAGAGALLLLFAAPDRENGTALPPLVLPGGSAVPGPGLAAPVDRAPARPSARRRAGACDGAEQALARPPRPLTPPQSWFTDDDYPALALMASHAGLTRAELVIDAGGRVIGCGVAGSSGHWSLDSRSCAVFRRRARFRPAEDARGCPVPSVWRQRVRWVIAR